MTTNKASLIKATAAASGHPESVVRVVLDGVAAVMTKTLVAGNEPYGLGLGRFSTVRRPPKKARDIRRGTEVDVPARTAVLFKPSKPLTEAVNGKREV